MMSQHELKIRAKELWDNDFMAKQWLRAVNNARQSKRGWVLDKEKRKNESPG